MPACLCRALHEAEVSLVAALPESLVKSIYRQCELDEDIRIMYWSVMKLICPASVAGTYLAGKRGLMIMENSGIRQCCEAVGRFAFCHGMPLVMVMSYRGAFGERNWWGHNHSQIMGNLLETLRIPCQFRAQVLTKLNLLLAKAFRHADASQWPVALVMTDECTEGAGL